MTKISRCNYNNAFLLIFRYRYEQHKTRISNILSLYVDMRNVIVLWNRGAQNPGPGSTGRLNCVRWSSNIWSRAAQNPDPRSTGRLNCVRRSSNFWSGGTQIPSPGSTGRLNCVRCSPNICGSYSVELVSYHGVWNFFVAPKLLVNLCTPSIKSKLQYYWY